MWKRNDPTLLFQKVVVHDVIVPYLICITLVRALYETENMWLEANVRKKQHNVKGCTCFTHLFSTNLDSYSFGPRFLITSESNETNLWHDRPHDTAYESHVTFPLILFILHYTTLHVKVFWRNFVWITVHKDRSTTSTDTPENHLCFIYILDYIWTAVACVTYRPRNSQRGSSGITLLFL